MHNETEGHSPTEPLQRVSNRSFYILTGFVSGVAVGAIAFFLLGNTSAAIDKSSVQYLPLLNAALNATAAMLLGLGFRAIKQQRRLVHQRFMVSAFVVSALFFCSYLVYHSIHGDTPYRGYGWLRPVYFSILISHILLSICLVPMALISLFLGFKNQLKAHRRLSRFTFPIWLYVSVTGVLIYVLLTSSCAHTKMPSGIGRSEKPMPAEGMANETIKKSTGTQVNSAQSVSPLFYGVVNVNDLKTLDVLCPAGQTSAWSPVTDLRTRTRIIALSYEIKHRREIVEKPTECHLRVYTRCAPDMNVDGKPELLAKLDWGVRSEEAVTRGLLCKDMASNETELADASLVILLTRDHIARRIDSTFYRVVDAVSYSAPHQRGARNRVVTDFVSLPNNQTGIRGEYYETDPVDASFKSGTWVGILAPDGLFRIVSETER